MQLNFGVWGEGGGVLQPLAHSAAVCVAPGVGTHSPTLLSQLYCCWHGQFKKAKLHCGNIRLSCTHWPVLGMQQNRLQRSSHSSCVNVPCGSLTHWNWSLHVYAVEGF